MKSIHASERMNARDVRTKRAHVDSELVEDGTAIEE
jgi:hypothetical protein